MNELHFEHLQRVTSAIGVLSAECAVRWDIVIAPFAHLAAQYVRRCILSGVRAIEHCQL
jgi:hypothetical protein